MSSDVITPNSFTFNIPGQSRRGRVDPTPVEAEAEAPVFPTTPIYARSRKSAGLGGVSTPVLLGGSVVALVLVGAAVAFSLREAPATEPVGGSVVPMAVAPQAPPVGPTGDPTLAAPPSEALAPLHESTLPPPRAEASAAEPQARPETRPAARVARARPAPAPAASADEAASEASAVLPGGPVPYSSLAPNSGMIANPGATPGGEAAAPPPAVNVPSVAPPPVMSTEPAPAPVDPVIPGAETAPTP